MRSKQDAIEGAKKDLQAKRREALFPLPAFVDKLLEPLVEDPRDLIMVHLLFNISVTTIPLAGFLFWSNPSNLLGLCYLGFTYFFYIQRFMLMLHYSEHRRLFKKQHTYLNEFTPKILSTFFGLPSGAYKAHHVVMHHLENNLFPWDISSTEPYQRDSVVGYLQYFGYWFICIWVLLPRYLWKRSRLALLKSMVASMLSSFAVIMLGYLINPTATMWVFVYPLLLSTLALSFGNYSQHIFIDPDNPRSNYSLTYNCINCLDNVYSFNDGYHVVHHINSRLHWTKMPQAFIDTVDKYKEEDALLFEGIGFFDVGILVLTRQFKKLASHCIQMDGSRTEEEQIALFKKRLQPIHIKQ